MDFRTTSGEAVGCRLCVLTLVGTCACVSVDYPDRAVRARPNHARKDPRVLSEKLVLEHGGRLLLLEEVVMAGHLAT